MPTAIHHTAGRLRLRSALTRRHPERAEGLAQRFRQIDGVLSTRISERTGSLTVIYDPRRADPAALQQVVGEAHTVVPPPPKVAAQPPARHAERVAKAGALFGKAAFDVLLAKTVERSVVSLLTALR